MKRLMFFKVLMIVTLIVSASSLYAQNMFVARGAKTLPQNGILLWHSFFYSDLDKSYSKTTKDYNDLKGDNSKFTSVSMLGYGILDNLELVAQVPVYRFEATKNGDTVSSSGFGDIVLQARFMAFTANEYLPALTLSALGRFPTGDEDDTPALGDGTYDFGLVTFISKKIMKFSTHLKLAYVFNGENDSDINIGNEFVYALKCDFTLIKQLKFGLQFSGFVKDEDRDKHDDKIAYTDKDRMNIIPMINYRPIKGLNIRPKVLFPIESQCKGGKLAEWTYAIDLFYTF